MSPPHQKWLFPEQPAKQFLWPAKGFNLVEIAVVLGILGLMIITVYAFIGQSYHLEDFVSEQLTAVEQARKGVETFVQELREAAPGDDGSYAIVSADSQSLIFFSDIDADVLTERVRYFLDGTELKKGVIEPNEESFQYNENDETISTVAKYIQNGSEVVFTYYNGDYPTDTTNNPLTYPADQNEIKLVQISLQVNVTPEDVPGTYTLNSFAQIRNLKTNL